MLCKFYITYTKMCKLTIRKYARMLKQECLEEKKNLDCKNVKKNLERKKQKQNKKTRKYKKEHKWKNLGLRNLFFQTFTRF